MISVRDKSGERYLFVASRLGLGWRARNGDWMRLKPPRLDDLYSERAHPERVTRLPFGWRIVRVPK